MSMYVADTLRRGQSGVGAFPVAEFQDLRVADVIVTDLSARNTLEEWRRTPYMTCYVISEDTEYRLGANTTIVGQVWTEIIYSDPDALGYDDVFDMDGFIQPGLIRNLFINDAFVVDSEAEMLALTTVTGNVVVRTDNGGVYLKLNDDDPSDLADFANITGNTGAVTSVNGSTGAVSITIANLLAVPQNQTDFDTAVESNSVVLQHSADIATLFTDKADLVSGTVPLSQLPYTVTNGISQTSAQFRLGGSLTQDTTISQGAFNFIFDASGAGNFGLNLGSDAPYDLIARDSSGYLYRIPKGTEGQVLKVSGGALTWSNDLGGTSGGSVAWGSITGTIASQSDLVSYISSSISAAVTGLWDDRGNYDPTATSNYPITGGSGSSGAILKGDIWTVSMAGTIGGVTVNPGDTVRALVDSPGLTGSNWAIAESNLGYTPLSNSLTSGRIFVGNASNIATAVDVTGVIAISNTGVTSFPIERWKVTGTTNLTESTTVTSSITDYLTRFINTSTSASAGGIFVSTEGASGSIILGLQGPSSDNVARFQVNRIDTWKSFYWNQTFNAATSSDKFLLYDASTKQTLNLGFGSGLSVSGGNLVASSGITNSAINNEIMKSNGTNAVGSGLFSLGAGNFDLGSNSIAGADRSISVASSDTDVNFVLAAKGTGHVQFYTSVVDIGTTSLSGASRSLNAVGSALNIDLNFFAKGTGSIAIQAAGSGSAIALNVGPTGGLNLTYSSTTQQIAAVGKTGTANDLRIQAGQSGTTNTDGGHTYLMYATKNGSAKDGNIALCASSVTWQSMERGVFIANAGVEPTGNPSSGFFHWGNNAAPKWRTGAGDIYSMDDAFYLGDKTTDGTWRIFKSGDDLLIQQRESGTYNTKSTISGA